MAPPSPSTLPAARSSFWINDRWRDLPAAHRQSIIAVCGGFVALLFFVGLLPMADHTVLATLAQVVTWLVGWGAPIVLLAVVIVCGMIVAESLTGKTHLQRLPLICAGVALIVLLFETRLVFGAPTGGMAGAAGAKLLRRLPALAAHLLLLGVLGLDALVLFRISWRDVGAIARTVAPRHPAPEPDALPPMPDPIPPRVPGWHSTPLTPARDWPLPDRGASARDERDERDERAVSDAGAWSGLRTASDALLESLRVPAYLQRTLDLDDARRAAIADAPTERRDFALPPLPLARSAPPTIVLEPRSHPPTPSPSGMARGSTAGSRTLMTAPNAPMRTGGDKAPWRVPPLTLLESAPHAPGGDPRRRAERLAATVERTFKCLGVAVEVRPADISVGPSIIRIGVRPAEHTRKDERGRVMVDATGDPVVTRTRISRIMHLKHDLALALAVKTLRMEAPVPERPYVGIEIPNATAQTVMLRDVLEAPEFRRTAARSKLAVALGRDVAGAGPRRRSGALSARADRGRDGRGQKRQPDRNDRRAPDAGHPRRGALRLDRSQTGGTDALRGHPASAGACRHRGKTGGRPFAALPG